MDNSLSESARFAVYREKLKGICEANNLSYVFIKNAYPIKLVIRPLGGVGEQMSMLEEASEDNYISPGASILFTVKDGNLTYRMSKTFTISDTLFNKIKNIFKNLVFDGEDKKQLYEKPYDIRVYNERKHCIETMFEAAYKLAYPPFGHRERQHDSWGTCIDLVHAIEHQQWLDAPENKREAPGTTNRSFDPVPLGHEPFPKIERVDE